MSVKPIPDGYHNVTPYLIMRDAAKAIEFYKAAFGAIEIMRMPMPNGGIAHAEIKIGDSPIMIADEFPDMGFRGPQSLGGSPVGLMVYVENVDTQFEKAVAAGATVMRPLQNQFYGDRSGTVTDPFGHVWTLGTHIEDLSIEELQRRSEEHMKNFCTPEATSEAA
jgi:PhnB protein